MRRILLAAASAVTLTFAGLTGAGAAGLSGQEGLRAAAGQLGLAQTVRRVCREVCRDGYCRTRCWNDDNYGYRERRVYREYDDEPVYTRRYHAPGPGVGVYAPGVGIGVGVGPGW